MNFRRFVIGMILFTLGTTLFAQGYLHADGKRIVDGDGNNFIIRSIGTGNWMIQEGYMMKSAGIAGTQHEFRRRLENTIGQAKTDSFYSSWLNNHFTRRDLDSMKAWGFNAVRPALHYKWFTLPVEDEPVAGEQTWLEKGFELTDSLVSWCTQNQMYVIFDMHGAPGGQGENADISDYDSSKPSLWESSQNKTKLVALWHKIAERYANEPFVGGYDLINETNWSFEEGNNAPLKALYERITDTIRLVDNNHIVFIEGNWFANDFSGLTPPWDDNLVYSFHKYWSFNGPYSLSYATWLRDDYNVPLWLGETGENSNTWFTNLIELAEKENIGWSWWPLKKGGLNNVMRVKVNSDYLKVIGAWKGENDPLGVDEAFEAVMQFSENHKVENCIIQYDVIDAMMRQPYTNTLKPFKLYSIGDYIFASDYALGKNGYAYYDRDTADYHGDTNEYTQWNKGGHYRNDGVDIERCFDADTTNGYHVGFIEDGEWMVYTMRTDHEVLADLTLRSAAATEAGYAFLEINGKVISDLIYLPPTGGWGNWRATKVSDILLPAGDIELKIFFVNGGVNLNYLKFDNPRSPENADFSPLLANTKVIENKILLHLNRIVDQSSLAKDDFTLKIDGITASIEHASLADEGGSIVIQPEEVIPSGSSLLLSYKGGTLSSNGKLLEGFTNRNVLNNIASFHEVPGQMEAEAFYLNNGLELEECNDEGGGLNTGYAHPGDYIDYILDVERPGTYRMDMRVALQNGNAKVEFLAKEDGEFVSLKAPTLMNTGGWQNWQTQATSVRLPGGKVHLRMKVIQGEFNCNWLKFSLITSVEKYSDPISPRIYPIPADDELTISFPYETFQGKLAVYDVKGAIQLEQDFYQPTFTINTSELTGGIYFLRISDERQVSRYKLLIN